MPTLPLRRSIRIVNPISGVGFTNRNRANRFVHSGRARWVDANTIEFLPANYRHVAAAQREVDRGYDGVTRMLTKREMANIPVVAPWKALIERSRRRAA